MRLSPVPLVVSPWLPTPWLPYAGTFVHDFSRYLRRLYEDEPLLVHVDDSYRSESPLSVWLAGKLVARALHRQNGGRWTRTLHVPLPVPAGSGWVERARVSRRLGGGIEKALAAEVGRGHSLDVHAHVGIVSGSMVHDWSTVRHRLFTYEHASFITPLLREDVEARQIYGATVTRSRRVFCVNPTMVNEMQEIYPPDAEKFQYVPNAVDFDRFPFRVRQPPLRKWLYIGNLKPAKGSQRLVEGFRLALERWGDITLTLVGSGADVGWVRDQGLGRSLRHLPPIPASEVPAVMSEADLLVHLSDGETFGLTAIEAVASGMPVLVTSTDGSELVIRPLEHDVGTILPQTMTPSDVADAYGELRDAPARLDLASARRSLESSFAPSQVTDLLARCLSATDLVHS